MGRMPYVRAAHYRRNEDRVKANLEPCAVCGRGIEVNDQAVFVRVVGAGAELATADEPEPEASDLGIFPVGPECRKKIPGAYLLPYPN